jgi:hypothetical protein
VEKQGKGRQPRVKADDSTNVLEESLGHDPHRGLDSLSYR